MDRTLHLDTAPQQNEPLWRDDTGVQEPEIVGAAAEGVFAPVESRTTLVGTLERLRTAITLGLLQPGARLPPTRELCRRLGISRSTLHLVLKALVDSGHLRATRGRGGGTFVAESPPPRSTPSAALLANWRDACDERLAVELAVAVLAAERADPGALVSLDELVAVMDTTLDDYPGFRNADVRWHIGLAEATGCKRLLLAMMETQGQMTDLFSHLAYPRELLASSNRDHAELLVAVRMRDGDGAMRIMAAHLKRTEQVLAGSPPPPSAKVA